MPVQFVNAFSTHHTPSVPVQFVQCFQYTPYIIRARTGGSLPVRLCDTRGIEETQGIDILECNSLLEGHIPEYYEVSVTTILPMNIQICTSKG